MIIENEFRERGFDNIICYSGKDITDSLIARCFKLDKAFYGKQFQWDNLGIETTIKKYNQMCFVFVDKTKGNIVGYSYWFPMKLEIINRYIKDKEVILGIKEEDCSPFNISPVHLFLGGEAFVPGYDLLNLHKVIEDIFQYHVLCLAEKGIKVETICFDAVCKYDEEYLVSRTNLSYKIIKNNCTFYYDKYSPNKMYYESKYCNDLKKYYN